ncbi:MAG: ABC transporter ATP-binding protein/permease [Bacilli bacterium]|nr:ABC transporter ATP-binding protein/permease [Bacilli bacterium]MBN2696457.1 ABC transporter ATP-binding protein/permease [Bacilli bacterium]
MIKLVNVSKYYHTNNVVALGLRKANLELRLNEFIAVVGESGSGKTTLLNVISGIDSYEEGEMYINGEETSYFSTSDLENYRKKYIAFVFQNYNLVDSFTVLQNVELPLLLAGYSKSEAKQRALEIIKRVGLEKHVRHKATKLSGGQKQRVVIARALAKNCPIIAADEPTGNLDSESARQILELLHEIAKDKLVIVVTHDFEQVKEYATRKIRIYDGEIVEDVEINKVNKRDLPVIGDEERKIRIEEHIRMAFNNLLAVPKKSILMVLVFFVFSFFVAMVYGAYNLAASGESESYDYYNQESFENRSISRLVMNKQDKSAFTEEELADIASMSQVNTVVPFDYLLDISVSFSSQLRIEALDYNFNYLGYVQFLPQSLISDQPELIAHGVMPTLDDQVLIVMPESMINDTQAQEIYLDQIYDANGSRNMSISPETSYEIVGMVAGEDLFLDIENTYFIVSDQEFERLAHRYYPAFLRNTTMSVSKAGVDLKMYPEIFTELLLYNGLKIVASESLDDDEMLFTYDLAYYFCDTSLSGDCDQLEADISFVDGYSSLELTDMQIDIMSEDEYQTLYVSSAVYDQIFYDDVYQVTVFADSDVNVSRLFSSLKNIKVSGEEKYKVIYPFDFQTDDQFGAAISFFETLGMLIALIATIIGSTFLSYIIFRTIINTKLKDYAIFRTVGANQMVIRFLIYLENVFVVIFSFAIFVAFTVVLKNTDFITRYSPFYALKVFVFTDYVIYFGIMILMSVLISSRYCGRVFRDTVQTSLKAE